MSREIEGIRMEWKNDNEKNIKQLVKIFNAYTACGRPHYKAAAQGAFELVRAKAAYDQNFQRLIENALHSRFCAFCSDSRRDNVSKFPSRRAQHHERMLRDALGWLGLRNRDAFIVLRAVRAAAFDLYCWNLIESRRFAK